MSTVLKGLGLRAGGWLDRHLLSIGIGTLLILLVTAALSPRIFITIPAGHAGVLFKRFTGGTDIDQVYDEGFHVVAPWNTMYVYDVRYQNLSSKFDAHTSDGLNLIADIAFRFRVTKRNVPLLHKFIGPDYVEKLILPDMGARVREAVSSHTPEEVYSTQRLAIQQSIRDSMQKAFEMNPESDSLLQRVEFVDLDEIFLRDVELPESLQRSMVEKNQQLQMMLEYDYRIEREKKESERKRIEAQGIRQFQDIVKDGITDRYLMWKGIDATLQLAQSANSKVIVIGSGQTGLPILLGNLDSTITIPSAKQPNQPNQPGKGASSALAPLTNAPASTETEDQKMALPPPANAPRSDATSDSLDQAIKATPLTNTPATETTGASSQDKGKPASPR